MARAASTVWARAWREKSLVEA